MLKIALFQMVFEIIYNLDSYKKAAVGLAVEDQGHKAIGLRPYPYIPIDQIVKVSVK